MSGRSSISTLLAVWFVLGTVVAPRFVCICSNGTTTVEVGQQYCCGLSCVSYGVVDDSLVDRCGCDESEEGCSSGCRSTLIEAQTLLLAEGSDLVQRGLPRPHPSTDVVTQFFWSTGPSQRNNWASRHRQSDGIYVQQEVFIRSVILLV